MRRIRRVLCLTALAVTASTLFAQCKVPTNHYWIAPLLDAKQQNTVNCLVQFNTLPDAGWRIHEGDLPHGESPTVADSSWPTAKVGSNSGKEAVWYRQRITIPKTLNGYDLTGTDISFEFVATANGPVPEIIYFDGRRVALGEDLEQIPLFDHAKPGQSILVAVKLLPTVDDKTFRGAQMRISFASNRPDPQDLATEIVSAANLLPVLAPNTAADKATLSKVIAQVDIHALAAAQQAPFDASLRAAQSTLLTLNPVLKQANFHLTGNSHIDAAWLWPWTETVDTAKRTFSSAVQLMNEYPTYTYTQSASAYSQWIADKYPALNAEIAKRVNEGRWELVGGMWVEPDLNMPDGESLVRQLLVGQAAFQKIYGHTAKIGWNPDSFGYSWQLPQIYKRSGIDFFVTQKMTWNDTNQLPLKLFWWESPDGSKVLAYFPHDYANQNVDPVRLSKDLAIAAERAPGLHDLMDLFGVGDHGGGPTRTMLDQGLHWMQPDKVGAKEEFGTALPYFQHVEKELAPNSPTWNYGTLATGNATLPTPGAGQISVPTWNDELYLEYHRGVFTTQTAHKRNMRDAEEEMLNAEKLASLAWLDGHHYPANELNDAWKHVLFNQFHDLAAGSGIGIIYKEAQKDYDQVRWATNEISANSIKTLASRINTDGKGEPILVFNPLALERGGVAEVTVQMPHGIDTISLEDERGNVIPSQVLSSDLPTHTFHLLFKLDSVPSIGYTVIRAVEGQHEFRSDLTSAGYILENSALRIKVDPKTGCITSLFDKRGNFEALAPNSCGNELQAFVDKPKSYDAWNIDPGTLDAAPTLLHEADEVKMIETSPLRSVLRVTRTWNKSKFVQDLILYAGSDELIVHNNFDWHEQHILLKAAFPLAATNKSATYEIPYGSIQRPTTRNNSFEKARFEVPALRWADEGDSAHGLSLLNNSKYGYDAVGNELRLSLLRAPTWPDPVADQGTQIFDYAIYPHMGTWQTANTMARGWEFNYKLHAMQVPDHDGTLPPTHSFFGIDGTHVLLTALKKAEDSDALIARFFEWGGESDNVTLAVPPGARSAILVNLMETPEGSPLTVTNDKVTVPISPYQIQTVRIDY
ncbi:MAG TPA: glycoside hydrolase family 38 C-terminal domain-containing protein [Acidobacteriaceae bacterium]|nr:glycoside hydrolase family 38 C-terminal domain-containing protein [Acidobacteriaceae bacterium]